jgi:hypothetical protein
MENGIRIINENIKSSKTDETTDITNINYINILLKENCKEFDEKYELLEKINSECGSGAVYRGKLRKKNNPKPIAFKFLRSKKKNKRKKSKRF